MADDYSTIYFPEFHKVGAVAAVKSGAVAFGWLAKQGGRIAQASKRRWFVLSLERVTLYYFKSQKDSEPSGFVPLEDCSVAVDPKRPLALVIAHARRRAFRLTGAWHRRHERVALRARVS